jgi:transposase
MEKKSIVFSIAVKNECGITIDHDINGARNIFMLLEKMIQKERRPEALCRSKINK